MILLGVFLYTFSRPLRSGQWRGEDERYCSRHAPAADPVLKPQSQRDLAGPERTRRRFSAYFTALALAQLKPGVEAAARGERHAQTQRLARSAARLHPDVGRPARQALPPVKPVPHLRAGRPAPRRPARVSPAPRRSGGSTATRRRSGSRPSPTRAASTTRARPRTG